MKKRSALLAMVFATGATLSPQLTTQASACCLTDWMYGRQPAVAAAPLPVTNGVSVPYTATYAPYAAGYAPYTAGYTPLITPPVSNSIVSNRPILASPAASAYSVQRPAYGALPLNNPSVYTGMPVVSGYRGSSSANAAFMGTGNVYPTTSPGVTAMRPVVAGATAPGFATPIRTGLARFFGSLLGTGYRSSYYTAPITYYRPATTIDPLTGTTITSQQACSSTVQQLQRTPMATFSPLANSPLANPNVMSGGVAPCGATGCGSDSNLGFGVSPIPSTMSPSTISPNGSGGFGSNGFANAGGGNADLQPLAPPTLPSNNFSGRPDLTTPYQQSPPSYDSRFSGPSSNMSPLTGARPDYRSEWDADRSSSNQYTPFSSDDVPSASDRAPLRAPSLNSARPAMPDESGPANSEDEYRRGYEAAKREMLERERQQQELDRIESERPPVRSRYQLDPPENSRPSTDSLFEEPVQRSRYEIERDQRDLRDLTTRNEADGVDSWHRVRPIPAPDNYRNPFGATKQPVSQSEPPSYRDNAVQRNTIQGPAGPKSASDGDLQAPALLPPLPTPASQFRNTYERPTRYSNETRLSVPVREASMQSPEPVTERSTGPKLTRGANQWQSKVRKQTRESGWYAK